MADYSNYKVTKKEAYLRILLLKEYLEMNTGKNRYKKLPEIQEYLEENDIPADRRTIYSDMLMLQRYMGMNIEYIHNKGYHCLNAPFEQYELQLMIDGIQSSKFIPSDISSQITNKILRIAGDAKNTIKRSSFLPERVRSMNESVVMNTQYLHQAISANKKVSFRTFRYLPNKTKEYTNKGQHITVSPFALLWDSGNYYLYAYRKDRNRFTYYRVDRIEDISPPLDENREGHEKFDKEAIVNQKVKVFGNFGVGKPQNVRIQFINALAGEVMDKFGRDVFMIPADDKHFNVTVSVIPSQTFFAWVSTFGSGAKILSPAPIVDKMKKFLTDAIKMYENDGEK